VRLQVPSQDQKDWNGLGEVAAAALSSRPKVSKTEAWFW